MRRLLILAFLCVSVIGSVASAQTKEDIQSLQQALNDMGYKVGTPDGAAGPKTKDRLTKFLARQNIAFDGEVTERVINYVVQYRDIGKRPVGLLTEIVTRQVYVRDLTDEQLCQFDMFLPSQEGLMAINKRQLDCGAISLALPTGFAKINDGIGELWAYAKKNQVQFPNFDLQGYQNTFDDQEATREAFHALNRHFSSFESAVASDPRSAFCREWLPKMKIVQRDASKNLDGTSAWAEDTIRDAYTICQDQIVPLATLMMSDDPEKADLARNWLREMVEGFVRIDGPNSFAFENGRPSENFPFILYMNEIFVAVELAGKSFGWSDQQWENYANWMRNRVYEMLPIAVEPGRGLNSKTCPRDKITRDTMRPECMNQAILTAQAMLRAAIVSKDPELAQLSWIVFHRYMTAMSSDGHPAYDGIRDCHAADYSIWAAMFLANHLSLLDQITEIPWDLSAASGGTVKETIEYAIKLTKDPLLANKYAKDFGFPDCKDSSGNRKQMVEESPLNAFAVYFAAFDAENFYETMRRSYYSGTSAYYRSGGSNYEAALIMRHPELMPQ